MLFLISIFGSLVDKAYANTPFAQYYCPVLHGGCGSGSSFVADLAVRAGSFFGALVAGGAVIAIIYAGIILAASGGNDQKKEDAKKIILYAVIGLILAIAVEGIMFFINSFMTSIP